MAEGIYVKTETTHVPYRGQDTIVDFLQTEREFQDLMGRLGELESGVDPDNRPAKMLRAWVSEGKKEELDAMYQALNKAGFGFLFFNHCEMPGKEVVALFEEIEKAGVEEKDTFARQRAKKRKALEAITAINQWQTNNPPESMPYAKAA